MIEKIWLGFCTIYLWVGMIVFIVLIVLKCLGLVTWFTMFSPVLVYLGMYVVEIIVKSVNALWHLIADRIYQKQKARALKH